MGKSSGGVGDPFPGNIREAQALSRVQEDALLRALQHTAAFNFFDVSTPFGSRQFFGTPGEEGFRQVETLSPFGQGLQSLGQQQLDAFGDIFTAPIGGEDLLQNAADVEQATFERGLNLLQPGFDEQTAQLENRLVQRGIPRSSEAFATESDLLSRQQNRALENLALSSVGAGRAEQSRAIQADLARRQGLLGELGFLGSGGGNVPRFQPVPQLSQQAPDVLGAFGLMNQNIAGQNALRSQQQSDLLGGLFGLGTAGILGGFGLFG